MFNRRKPLCSLALSIYILVVSTPTALKFIIDILKLKHFFNLKSFSYLMCLCMLFFLPVIDLHFVEFWSASYPCRSKINIKTFLKPSGIIADSLLWLLLEFLNILSLLLLPRRQDSLALEEYLLNQSWAWVLAPLLY